jgi:hypothetical protein
MSKFCWSVTDSDLGSLAWHEMRLILAKIIWHFDMELVDGSERWNEQKCFVLWSKGPLMVRLVPRVEEGAMTAGTTA